MPYTGAGDYMSIDDIVTPDELDEYIDVMDFPSGGKHRMGSDVLDQLIKLEQVRTPKNRTPIDSRGKEFLDSVIAGATKLPRANPGDFRESMPGSQIPGGRGWYNEDNPGRYDQEIPDPFGTDLFTRAAVPASLGYVG